MEIQIPLKVGHHWAFRWRANDAPGGGGGGEGVALIFSSYVGSDLVSTVHPLKNIRNFKHPEKYFRF